MHHAQRCRKTAVSVLMVVHLLIMRLHRHRSANGTRVLELLSEGLSHHSDSISMRRVLGVLLCVRGISKDVELVRVRRDIIGKVKIGKVEVPGLPRGVRHDTTARRVVQ